MKNLKVSLIQTDLQWENPAANRHQIAKEMAQLAPSDLILLPEMFTTAFSMDSTRLAEKMDGESVQWMKEQAEKHQAVVCGSLIIAENGKYYNRLIWMRADGSYEYYDKRHLFRMADEEKHFSSGTKRLIVELNDWKICPLICYDLRFPVWSRRKAKENFDLLIYVANWPSPRAAAWEKLLYARAIENQSYVLGLNRIGEDAKGNTYIGKSMAIDPKGEAIWQSENKSMYGTVELNYEAMTEFREKFPVILDADEFDIKN